MSFIQQIVIFIVVGFFEVFSGLFTATPPVAPMGIEAQGSRVLPFPERP